MTFDIFLEQIPELGNTSASQLICFFGYYIIDIQKKESFFPKDIDNCFQMAQISPYSNIPSFLSTKSKGKNSIFIKNKQIIGCVQNYFLENALCKNQLGFFCL